MTSLKARWIAALRSGEYSQGYCMMRDLESDEYCCLGVLADIIDPNGWELVDDWTNWPAWRGCQTVPPLGILPYELAATLVGMNDGDLISPTGMKDRNRMSFAQIADWIELHVEEGQVRGG